MINGSGDAVENSHHVIEHFLAGHAGSLEPLAFLEGLRELSSQEPLITAPRGRGLMAAFDLPDKEQREQFYTGLFEIGLLALRCGERSIRFRPALNVTVEAVGQALEIIRAQCQRMRAKVPGTGTLNEKLLPGAGTHVFNAT